MAADQVTIYVSGGDLSAPFYRFFLDELGTVELANLTLYAEKSYQFKRLDNASTHPFYISDSGHNQESTNHLILEGDGSFSSGITGEQ